MGESDVFLLMILFLTAGLLYQAVVISSLEGLIHHQAQERAKYLKIIAQLLQKDNEL